MTAYIGTEQLGQLSIWESSEHTHGKVGRSGDTQVKVGCLRKSHPQSGDNLELLSLIRLLLGMGTDKMGQSGTVGRDSGQKW